MDGGPSPGTDSGIAILGQFSLRQPGRSVCAGYAIRSGLFANVVSLGFSWAMQDFTPSLGASGAIFGITGALLWIVLRNRGRHKTITLSKMIFLIVYSQKILFLNTITLIIRKNLTAQNSFIWIAVVLFIGAWHKWVINAHWSNYAIS